MAPTPTAFCLEIGRGLEAVGIIIFIPLEIIIFIVGMQVRPMLEPSGKMEV